MDAIRRTDGRRRHPGTTNDRILIVLVIGWGLLGLLWARCVWLQLFDAPRLAAMASAQHHTVHVVPARRGAMVDRTGRPLAVTVMAPSIYANARQVTAKQQMASQLAETVRRDAGAIRRRLEKDKGFVWIARQVEPSVTPALLTLRKEGIGWLEEPKRLYPQGRLASHVLGFVDIDQRGLEGLELSLNRTLQGRAGRRATLRDAKGSLLVGPWTEEAQPVDGHDVTLTIDSIVQQAAEEELARGVKKYHAKGGSIIVMEPFSGEILAMANAPAYDPNAPVQEPVDARRNRAVTDLFEPGSTFKIITAAALLEERRITPDEMIFCENAAYPTVGRHILHDHRPHGLLSFFDVIKLSSNIGTAKAAQRLKPDELYRYAQAFGVGRKTGIDVPGEINGMLHPPSRWSKLSPYIIPIGQEVAVTPIQLAVMTAVIANGGLRVQPHIIHGAPTAQPVRVISQETVEIVQHMLTEVVESGTGQLANVQGLTVAGKTGTAQKLEPTGRYSHSRFVASFVGFGPVPDPRFVMVVSLDEPRPLYFGGVVSAPIFKRVVERLVSYWGLKRSSKPTTVAQLPGLAND
ncbi:MAG: penicillin-binding protein 2 [Candidatus Omnitrophica bacterium]|nr:penicillin-binding protein 2 [Candidatus Omnitrophota bacterium]